MKRNKLLDWRIESALTAHEMLTDEDPNATREDMAQLRETLQAVTTAYVIVHRRRPTLNEIVAALMGYRSDQELIDRALRTAVDRTERQAAKRCEAWLKADDRGGRSQSVYVRNTAGGWCQKNPDRANAVIELIPDEDRAEALKRLGWEMDLANDDGAESQEPPEPSSRASGA